MADLLVTARNPAPAAVAGQVGLTGTISDPPSGLERFAVGHILHGLVTGQDGKGNTLIRTDLGLITLATQQPLPEGAEITLQIRSIGARIQVIILQVAADARGAAKAGPSPSAGPSSHGPLPDRIRIGRTIGAVVQSAPPGPLGLPAGIVPPAPGAELRLRILSVAAADGRRGDVAEAGTAAARSILAAGQRLAALAQGKTEAQVIQAASTDSGATPSVTLRLTGLVTGATNAGQPLLQTGLGTLSFLEPAPIPPGSSVAMELRLVGTRTTATPPTTAGQSPPSPWPALAELAQALAAEPALKAEVAGRLIPEIGPRLGPALLLFLSALKTGQAAAWLGERAGLLAKAIDETFPERLAKDFAVLAQGLEVAGGAWRLYPLPLLHDGILRQLRLLRRREQEHSDGGGGRERSAAAQRFVIRLELPRLGAIELDGLLRGRRFDLILRSATDLPPTLVQQLREIFVAANEGRGMTGQIAFRSDGLETAALTARPGASAEVIV